MAVDWLAAETNCSESAARQAVEYVAAQKAAVDVVPTQTRVVFERFFDESGGMQLVVHAPFGGRVNRAWGLAMRKRFCRSFDFELQASADDEGFVLSLGPLHSFPIESLFPMLRPDNVRSLLEQALLAVPLFHMRWRWNVTRALQVDRRRNGRKVAPALQRFRSEDLLTAVFPKLTGCQEEHTGDHQIPGHPLVRQTVDDCLQEALDLEGLTEILDRVQRGEITFVARDTREPSPFAYELLNANPYAFLDGGELQERRARAVATRRSLSVESVQDLGRLDPQAITQVVGEAQPLIRNADELHDVLLSRIWWFIDDATHDVVSGGDAHYPAAAARAVDFAAPLKCAAQPDEWRDEFAALASDGRATTVTLPDGRRGWVAAERLPAVGAMFPDAVCDPVLGVPDGVQTDWTVVEARVATVRGLMEVAGPTTAFGVARRTGITPQQADAALEALEGEGVVLRGRFTPEKQRAESEETRGHSGGHREECHETPSGDRIGDANPSTETCTTKPQASTLNSQLSTLNSPPAVEWCHRRLLARIHRLTVAGLRREIEPVDVPTFLRFLTRHQGVLPASRKQGANGLFEVIGQLQGLDLPAISWERDVLGSRVDGYQGAWLDELCLTGEVGWGRLYPPARDPEKSRPMASITRLAPVSLFLRDDLSWLLQTASGVSADDLSSPAQQVLEVLQQRGAMFAADLMNETRLLPAQIDDVLGELVTRGFATSDGFAGLRTIARAGTSEPPKSQSRRTSRTVARRRSAAGAGRWSVWRNDIAASKSAASKSVASKSVKSKSVKSRPAESKQDREDRHRQRRDVVEQWAWQLLRRWGVVFRDLLQKESGAPRWWELTQVYRRLEARGEIRGGRFVQGVAGEQFALGDTVRELRRLRDDGSTDDGSTGDADDAELLVLSAVDPLNLVGVLTGHPRVPSRPSNSFVLLRGQPVAATESGQVTLFDDCPAQSRPTVVERCEATLGEGPLKKQTAPSEDPSPGELEDRHARRFDRKRRPAASSPPSVVPRPIIS